MTTTKTPPKTEVLPQDIFLFIKRIKEIEAYSEKEFFKVIAGSLTRLQDECKISHICDQWRWKKGQFGEWWLNLDNETRICLLQYWCFDLSGAQAYLDKISDEPISAMFLNPPAHVTAFTNVIKFFENHAIDDAMVEEIDLPVLPAKEMQYGNTKNWVAYILFLSPHMHTELHQVLTTIRDYYPKRRLTNQ